MGFSSLVLGFGNGLRLKPGIPLDNFNQSKLMAAITNFAASGC